jgi:hypothetical protein
VLARWEQEKTTLISDGCDRRSNLDLSIFLSLSSPRMKVNLGAQELLGLLSILPDGLSDAELVQSKLPIANILSCKAALICTALAYSDKQKQMKALVPIREYIQKIQSPRELLIQPLQYFLELLELYIEFRGTQPKSGLGTCISTNYTNIQNIVLHGLQEGHTDLINSIYCACHLNTFARLTSQGRLLVMAQIPEILPQPPNPQLEVCFITSLFASRLNHPIPIWRP